MKDLVSFVIGAIIVAAGVVVVFEIYTHDTLFMALSFIALAACLMVAAYVIGCGIVNWLQDRKRRQQYGG